MRILIVNGGTNEELNMSDENGETRGEDRKFETTDAAFVYACESLNTVIVPEQPLIAIVLDSAAEFGAEEAISTEADGSLRLTLKVASSDGGFIVVSKTAKPPADTLAPGDLVCWVPLKHDAGLAEQANDPRFGWIGLVFATLEPEFNDDEWSLREFYE